MPEKRGLSYRDAGVDIDAGDALVARIKPIAARTRRAGCLGAIGGFGGLFQLPADRYREPVLVAGADGVGTKLKLAQQLDRHDTIGIDLVAMCANDVLVCGAEPLFFLDYFATGRLEPDIAATVIAGIGRGCEAAGAALIGGETAEMPGMYPAGEYDLAGFCVGVVEKDRIIDGTAVAAGDVVLGLASSGPHANGYSLIRRIIAQQGATLAEPFDGATLADRLLAPTRIYVKPVLELLATCQVKALAHITGGGLPGNLVRVIPNGHHAVLDTTRWRWPAVFQWLQDGGAVAREEMYRAFNCGIGFTLILDPGDAAAACAQLEAAGETVYDIGRVEAGGGEASVVIE